MEKENKELGCLELVTYVLEEQEDGSCDLEAIVSKLIEEHTTEEQYSRFVELMNEIGQIIGTALKDADLALAVEAHE